MLSSNKNTVLYKGSVKMSKYDEMSDFEINKAVGGEIFRESLEDGYEFEWRKANSLFSASEAAELFINNGSGFYRETSVDYCNNPTDMWPIINNSHMSIELPHPDLGWVGTISIYNSHGTDWQVDFSEDESPLRAAAIVFLMMQESAKCSK
jgi:hypothetical protein